MKLYRFSPIQSQASLMECIKYLHETCHKLCYKHFGEYLPVAGNVGIFCHYPEEFRYLTKLREEMTDSNVHYNNKYFMLHESIHIPVQSGIPAATYKYLYIRRLDPYRAQVGDVDFVLEPARHRALAATLNTDEFRNDARMHGRLEENMIELWNPDYDVMTYIVTEDMEKKVKTQNTRSIVAIAKQDVWERALKTGEYTQSTIDSTLADVGFIHCSFPDQTIGIANRRFADQSDLVLLLIDVDKVESEVKYEGALSGRAGTFPHIYGPLNTDAVYTVVPLRKDEQGKFVAPKELEQAQKGNTGISL